MTVYSEIRNPKSEILLECVPNFSEGRNINVVREIALAIETREPKREANQFDAAANDGDVITNLQPPTSNLYSSPCVLDTHLDADHNRAVITFVAPPEEIVDAAVRAVKRASELIDLRAHKGTHPRLGATDVLPFIPLVGATFDDCIRAAHATGARIAAELGIPVFYYERAALLEARRRLEDVRRGGYELLCAEIGDNPARCPDAGEQMIHLSAGACIVGVRDFLIAYNINLATDDAKIARKIARDIHAKSADGLPAVKALGMYLASTGRAQVSMNLTDYRQTGLQTVFERVQRAAHELGVEIHNNEIVGLVPRAAWDVSGEFIERLANPLKDYVLENQIAVRCRALQG